MRHTARAWVFVLVVATGLAVCGQAGAGGTVGLSGGVLTYEGTGVANSIEIGWQFRFSIPPMTEPHPGAWYIVESATDEFVLANAALPDCTFVNAGRIDCDPAT